MIVDVSDDRQDTVTAVLCSGGLDSAVLVAHEARTSVVQPIYVDGGLPWEVVEREYLERLFMSAAFGPRVRPWTVLECPVADVYPSTHWALSGTAPSYATPDSEVYLVGRNVMLLSKTAVYCAVHQIRRIAVGPLAGNPFPDATPAFFDLMARAMSTGLDHEVEIVAPFSTADKSDVIRLGTDLGVPFEHTISCAQPTADAHCGRCSKCRERLQAFDAADLVDPARYTFWPGDLSTGT